MTSVVMTGRLMNGSLMFMMAPPFSTCTLPRR